MRDLSTAIVKTTSHVIRHANLLAPERGHRLSTAIRTDTGLGAGGIEMTKRPDRYRNAIVPHIYVDGASDAIAFYKRAFGAVELFRIAHADGKIVHAEISICGSVLMIGDPDDRLY